MDVIRKLAFMCTGRAVLFGGLAICTIMLSLAFAPMLSLKVGAILTLMMTVILIAKSRLVLRQKPERTEVWLYLKPETRPSGPEAHRVFATILQDVYLYFARLTFQIACAFFAGAAVLAFANFQL